MNRNTLLAGLAAVAVAGHAVAQHLPRAPQSPLVALRAGLPEPPSFPPITVPALPLPELADTAPPSFNSNAGKMFATRVQPVLANACTSCHARKDHASRFKMRHMSGDYADSEATAANLRAAARVIARDNPAESLILTKAVVAHGGATEPPLRSRTSAAFRNLEIWVHWAAAPEGSAVPDVPVSAPPAVSARPPLPLPPSLQQVGAKKDTPAVPELAPAFGGSATHLVLGPKEPGKLPPLPTAEPLAPGGFASGTAGTTPASVPTKPNPADEFDPAAFNRAMHPMRR